MENYIKNFHDISIEDISEVGGKNASLGEMVTKLAVTEIAIPNGFAVTASAFRHFIWYNKLDGVHERLLAGLDRQTFANLKAIGEKARELILHARMPNDLADAITITYSKVFEGRQQEVAVRSSATAEDLPEASFAGQHDSYLNIKDDKSLVEAVKRCFASLYTDRAIKYREDNRFDHNKVFISVGIQEMVRSDKACSGVGFTLEPESGFRDVIHLAGVWGLGENIVQGTVTPDEFLVFKPSLKMGKKAIIQKTLGTKDKMMVYSNEKEGSTLNLDTPSELKEKFVLTDGEIHRLAKWALVIEEHYRKPMDIEWAKDGVSDKLYIIQARPETVQSRENKLQITEYHLKGTGKILVQGEAVGNKIAAGRARIILSPADSDKLQKGDILVTDTTSPDWDPILKKVSAIVTCKGGRTSHASIVARELGVPAIVGTGNALDQIKDGDMITVCCAEGKTGIVYEGILEWNEEKIDFGNLSFPENTKVNMILGEPEKAFSLSFYPCNGIGLMRIEFIISHNIQIHPMALVRFNKLEDKSIQQKIEELTHHYPDKKAYFIDKLSQGVATIAAAFYPREVIVRMSDFKTNEYANLIGGKTFEPEEENPMIGFRGASRYYNDLYKEGFRLECEAMKIVRDEMGLTNVKLMIPFCRTPEEGKKVIAAMKESGLEQKKNDLEIYVMAEIPSNVILAEEFAGIFDGFSIGSNDLTQLVLGTDRDSAILSSVFDEKNAASKEMIRMLLHKAKKEGKKVGICGQGPSDSEEFAQFLVEEGIDSISFTPDALINGIKNICKAEASMTILQTI